jgi:putative FmdB family regulatory protein
MPIYAYRCESCGFGKDVLQKMSDAPLTDCPECGKSTFRKQVTAAGFQLKGSGWYVTDFRGGSSGGSAKGSDGAASPAQTADDKGAAAATKSDGGGTAATGDSSTGSASGAAAAPAAASPTSS